MAAAERRKAEQLYVKDKHEAKKREKEEGESETQKFVTKAYESHLSDNKRRIDLEKKKEIYDKEHSVTNNEFGMMGFYSTLLTKNKLFSESEKVKETDNKKMNKDEIHKIVPKEVVNEIVENIKIDEPKIQPKNKTNETTLQDNTVPEANTIDKADEYKKRYLERKRNRDNI
jgi:hypothetical protein